jgi:small subunit ribosomal protein S2
MKRLPAAIFVVDVSKEQIAVKEAQKLHLPIFGMVDTNSDPSIDFVIPSNDDAAKSIAVIIDTIVAAINEGLEERKIEKTDKPQTEKKDSGEAVKTRARKEKE